MFNKPNPKQSFPELEEDILKYWEKNKIFEKSIEKNKGKQEYVFYDGPPFATGLPHYGHILAGTLKDVIPRYQTMRGCFVPRRWGWDCHGLPVENLVEKELGLEDKQALLEFGIGKFNEACRSSVLRYTKEWGKVVRRMGRWVDFENSYKTMSSSFMESIWWVFRALWDKKLIYKGKKSMHICPRCVTPLSNFEVGLGYKDITDFSCTAQFKLKETDQKKKLFGDKPTYVLAWTTTTWTLPGNLILAVGEDIEYVIVESAQKNHENPSQYIIAQDCFEGYRKFFPDLEDLPDKTIKGKKLVGLDYEPLFNVYEDMGYENLDKAWKIYTGDFVTTESGTGIVHIASGYGEDDMVMAQDMKMPIIQHIKMDGKFIDELGAEFEEVNVVGSANKKKADEFVAQKLKEKGFFFADHQYRHSYPHCWRCDTPLLNYATDSWFVDIDKVKKKMIISNQKINWVPFHIKDGRFGKWLEGARDWAISRNRYWGTPLPIWEGEKGSVECLGSIADLREKIPKRFTKITLVRHGESEGNTIGLRQSQTPGTGLTKRGKRQSRALGKKLAKIHSSEPFDNIIHSPLRRTKETAQLISEELNGLALIAEPLITEINFGSHEGKRDIEIEDYMSIRRSQPLEERYHSPCGGDGESHSDLSKRAMVFIKKILKEYPGQSILVVTHSDIIRFMLRELNGDSLKLIYSKGHFPIANSKEIYLDNETGKLVDLHKHFVDDMEYQHYETGETMRRIPEVLDCWFESGSMPYAQAHYPFENKDQFEATFPANFIAEGLDQTRGWFYTLIVLSSALFSEPAFQNVIVNGIVLAEDGHKMSKRKKNYPDPQKIFDNYGADAMRIYLMNSPVVKADDFRFSEKGVQETVRSTLLPLWNSYSFLLTYAEIDQWKPKGQIYFVRHGQTDVNKANRWQGAMDEPLNHEGVNSLNELRKTTRHLPIDVIVSSNYIRAKHSADILNTDFDLEIEELEGLQEQHFGDHEGKPFENDLKEHGSIAKAIHEIRKSPKDGESLADFEKRVVATLEDIMARHEGKNILLVAHGGVYLVLQKYFHEIKTWDELFTHHFHYFMNGEIKLFETAEFYPTNKLDRWVISELHTLIQDMTDGLDSYDLMRGLAPLVRFIDSLTNWYIRRSRRRFWKSENDEDKEEAYQTLYLVLVDVCKLLAPFAPFMTESMYRNLTGLESVHLTDWPEVEVSRIDESLNRKIEVSRQIVTLGHAARAKANMKVRQPLSKIEVALPPGLIDRQDLAEQLDVIREELNLKEIFFLDSVEGKARVVVKPNARLLGPKLGGAVQDLIRDAKAGNYELLSNGNYRILEYELTPEEIEIVYEPLEGTEGCQIQADQGIVVILDSTITPELRREGYARDIVRSIQDLRKQADLNVSDRIVIGLTTDDKDVQTAIMEFQDYIRRETLAIDISAEKRLGSWESVLKLGSHGLVVTIEKH